MSSIDQPNTPENREKARSRLRNLTRGVVVAAAGATVVIGVVVSRDHPGSATSGSSATRGTSSGSGAATTNGGSSATSGSSSTGSTGSTGTTGTTGNTGTSSSAPSVSQSSPTVTSGGSSR